MGCAGISGSLVALVGRATEAGKESILLSEYNTIIMPFDTSNLIAIDTHVHIEAESDGNAADEAARNAARAKQQAAINKSCAADMAKLCGGQTGPGARRCLVQNRDSLSDACKAAMPQRRRPGGGGGPGAAP